MPGRWRAVSRPRGAFASSPSPKYVVEFAGAGHLAWTDPRPDFHPAILETAVAFLDRYIRGTGDSSSLTFPSDGVATLRYSSELGTAVRPTRTECVVVAHFSPSADVAAASA